MKFGIIALAVILLILVGGFGYFAFVDIPVPQTEVSQEIPHDRLAQP